MINILSIAKTVYGGWSLKSSEKLDTENIQSAQVVMGDYGLNICFFLKTGQKVYQSLSTNSKLNEGDVPELDKLKVLTLTKPGNPDCYKIEEEQ